MGPGDARDNWHNVRTSDTMGSANESGGISEDYFMGGGKINERSFILKSQEVAPL